MLFTIYRLEVDFSVHLDLARSTLSARDNAECWDSDEVSRIGPAHDIEGIHEIGAQFELEPLADGYGFSDFKRFRPLTESAHPGVVFLSVAKRKGRRRGKGS